MSNLLHSILRPTGRLLVALALFAGVVHGLHRTGGLRPWPLLDMDRTILWQKIEMADRGVSADTLLFGDSSCLMGIDVRALVASSGGARVLNYGTVSHLSLASQEALLDRHLARTRVRPRRVVLMLHPDALRREEPVPAVEQAFATMLAGRVASPDHGLRARVEGLLGVHLVRETLQARVLPVPLLKGQGRRYGFTTVVRDTLFEQDGSLVATGCYHWATGQGQALYWISKATRQASRAWAERVPADVHLSIALSPLPASFAPPDYAGTAEHLVRQWAECFGRPVEVMPLPAILPDAWMADRLHANEEGQRALTARMAAGLAGFP